MGQFIFAIVIGVSAFFGFSSGKESKQAQQENPIPESNPSAVSVIERRRPNHSPSDISLASNTTKISFVEDINTSKKKFSREIYAKDLKVFQALQQGDQSSMIEVQQAWERLCHKHNLDKSKTVGFYLSRL